MSTPPPPPLDRLLYTSDLLRVGSFRARPDHPRFRDSGPIERHVFVFPRTSVGIRHEGRPGFLTDTRTVTYYNAGQRYERQPLDPRGDRCEWFAVRADVLREVIAVYDPSVEERPEQPFPFSHGPSSSRAYLFQRVLVRHLREGAADDRRTDRAAIEEGALATLDEIVGLACSAGPGVPTGAAIVVGAPRPLDPVTELRRLLACRFHEPLSLDDMAAAVGLSVFHLCRTFRRATGTTIVRHRNELRLRRSLELVADPGSDLTGVALDLGYSSHSHFSASFRKAFGMAPSAFRSRASTRRIRELAAGLGTLP